MVPVTHLSVEQFAYPVRSLAVEAFWPDLEQGEWRSDVKPAAVIGSVLGWIASGLPVVMAGDHQRAGRYVSRMLFITARRRWQEARSLIQAVWFAPYGSSPPADPQGALGMF